MLGRVVSETIETRYLAEGGGLVPGFEVEVLEVGSGDAFAELYPAGSRQFVELETIWTFGPVPTAGFQVVVAFLVLPVRSRFVLRNIRWLR